MIKIMKLEAIHLEYAKELVRKIWENAYLVETVKRMDKVLYVKPDEVVAETVETVEVVEHVENDVVNEEVVVDEDNFRNLGDVDCLDVTDLVDTKQTSSIEDLALVLDLDDDPDYTCENIIKRRDEFDRWLARKSIKLDTYYKTEDGKENHRAVDNMAMLMNDPLLIDKVTLFTKFRAVNRGVLRNEDVNGVSNNVITGVLANTFTLMVDPTRGNNYFLDGFLTRQGSDASLENVHLKEFDKFFDYPKTQVPTETRNINPVFAGIGGETCNVKFQTLFRDVEVREWRLKSYGTEKLDVREDMYKTPTKEDLKNVGLGKEKHRYFKDSDSTIRLGGIGNGSEFMDKSIDCVVSNINQLATFLVFDNVSTIGSEDMDNYTTRVTEYSKEEPLNSRLIKVVGNSNTKFAPMVCSTNFFSHSYHRLFLSTDGSVRDANAIENAANVLERGELAIIPHISKEITKKVTSTIRVQNPEEVRRVMLIDEEIDLPFTPSFDDDTVTNLFGNADYGLKAFSTFRDGGTRFSYKDKDGIISAVRNVNLAPSLEYYLREAEKLGYYNGVGNLLQRLYSDVGDKLYFIEYKKVFYHADENNRQLCAIIEDHMKQGFAFVKPEGRKLIDIQNELKAMRDRCVNNDKSTHLLSPLEKLVKYSLVNEKSYGDFNIIGKRVSMSFFRVKAFSYDDLALHNSKLYYDRDLQIAFARKEEYKNLKSLAINRTESNIVFISNRRDEILYVPILGKMTVVSSIRNPMLEDGVYRNVNGSLERIDDDHLYGYGVSRNRRVAEDRLSTVNDMLLREEDFLAYKNYNIFKHEDLIQDLEMKQLRNAMEFLKETCNMKIDEMKLKKKQDELQQLIKLGSKEIEIASLKDDIDYYKKELKLKEDKLSDHISTGIKATELIGKILPFFGR